MTARRRLDAELVRRELATSLDHARALIGAHRVLVGGSIATTDNRMVAPADPVHVAADPPRFVSRAGEKLDGALERFDVDVSGRVALDVGSSTGGFTDCLVSRGVLGVVCVDVGTNQLHEKLRADPRVEVREKTDVRSLCRPDIPGSVDLVTVDLSFVSVVPIISKLVELGGQKAELVILVKPQFEARRIEADRASGVITDPSIWRRSLEAAVSALEVAGAGIIGVMRSPLRGAAGNVEFFVHARQGSVGLSALAIEHGMARSITDAN